MCIHHCTKAQKDPFEVADQFRVPIRSELAAPPLEDTIPIKEYLYVCAHSRYMTQMGRLNGMPRCITERAICARWKFENCVSRFLKKVDHVAKYASNSFYFGREVISIIYRDVDATHFRRINLLPKISPFRLPVMPCYMFENMIKITENQF
jgi:hypothetical protein